MLKINWMEKYSNDPTFYLEDRIDLLPMEDCEFTFKDGLWYHIQENGLVRYFAHTGSKQNEGGFGGARFDFLHNGEPRSVLGAWSSRASYLNTILPNNKQLADIVLDNGKSHTMHVGILVSELIKYWAETEAWMLRVKKPGGVEQGPITASMAPNCILKPNGARMDRGAEYEIFAEPVHVF